MAHRLGSLVPVSPAREFRPGAGSDLGGGVWEDTFTGAAPTVGNTKFMILHFAGVTLNAGDRLEVPLGNGDTDTFTTASGADFWTRPIKGGTVAIRFVDGGSGAGKAPLTEFGRGEGIVRDGVDGGANIDVSGGNGNGDVFMLDTPYVDPPHFNPGGVCPPGARHWANVDSLPAGVMRDVARSTGMFLEVSEGKVSSCSAALIGPDLILTAGHCRLEGSVIPSGSFTLDFQTDASGNRPAGYTPRFHKLKAGPKTGFSTAPTGGALQPKAGELDYAIIQIETPPGGLGVPPLPIRADLPPVGEEVFLIHHPRGATKKVSQRATDPGCFVQIIQNNKIFFGGDVDNGSSGSPLFDLMRPYRRGERLGGFCPQVVDGNAQGISAQAAAAILTDMATAPPPATDVDVVLVFDRSGSMSLPGVGGGTKIQQAREAAALFIDLLRLDRTHRGGLVTFSTTASVAGRVGADHRRIADALIGPPPGRTGGADRRHHAGRDDDDRRRAAGRAAATHREPRARTRRPSCC